MNILDRIDAIVADLDLGTASAAKRGRNPAYPYVPLIKYTNRLWDRTENPTRHVAYATRDEAVARAQWSIDATREMIREKLKQPRYRAMRKQYGLPEEI